MQLNRAKSISTGCRATRLRPRATLCSWPRRAKPPADRARPPEHPCDRRFQDLPPMFAPNPPLPRAARSQAARNRPAPTVQRRRRRTLAPRAHVAALSAVLRPCRDPHRDWPQRGAQATPQPPRAVHKSLSFLHAREHRAATVRHRCRPGELIAPHNPSAPSTPKASSRTQRACTPTCFPGRSTCSPDYGSQRPPHCRRRQALLSARPSSQPTIPVPPLGPREATRATRWPAPPLSSPEFECPRPRHH
jgi:hypothetical protein